MRPLCAKHGIRMPRGPVSDTSALGSIQTMEDRREKANRPERNFIRTKEKETAY